MYTDHSQDHELRILDTAPMRVKGTLSTPSTPTVKPTVTPTKTTTPSFQFDYLPVMAWDLGLSDTALRFSNGGQTATRPGNVSCYPAALTLVPAVVKSSFTTGII